MNADEMFKQYKELRSFLDRLLGKQSREIRKRPEYKELLAEIAFLEEHLRLARSQQRLMGRRFEPEEIKDLKQKVREAWDSFCQKRKEEVECYKETEAEQ